MINQLLLLTVGLLPLYRLSLKWGWVSTNVVEIMMVVVIILGFFSTKLRHQLQLSIKRTPLLVKISIGGIVIASLVSIAPILLASLMPSPTLLRALGILKSFFIVPIIFSFLGGAIITTHPHFIVRLNKALIFSGLGVSLLGISQLGQVERIKSLYDVPNSLALYLLPIIFLALWPPSSAHRRTFEFFAGIIMVGAVVATQSLGALLALGITASSGALLWQSGSDKKKTLLTLVGLFIVIVAYLTVSSRISYFLTPVYNSSVATSLAVRWQLWSISSDIIHDQLVLGVGLGQFEPIYQTYLHQRFIKAESLGTTPPIPEFVFRDPHNWLLSFWINTGLLGLLSFITLNGAVFSLTLPRAASSPQLQRWILSLITTLLFGLTDTIFWKNDLSALYWVTVTVVVVLATLVPAAVRQIED